MVIESSRDVFAPIFRQIPQSQWVSSLLPWAAKGHPRPSFTGKYGHSPRVGETFCGQARHFIHGLQPTQKHVECPKNLAKSEPINDTKFGRFTSESLDESQWFPSDHQQTTEPIVTATEMLPLWLGSQIQRPLQKKTKNCERLLVSLNGRIARSMILLKSTFVHTLNVILHHCHSAVFHNFSPGFFKSFPGFFNVFILYILNRNPFGP